MKPLDFVLRTRSRAVFRVAQADVAYGDGFLTEFAQQRGERGRKLRIDDELHATTSTA